MASHNSETQEVGPPPKWSLACRLNEFLEKTTLHGLRYIVEPGLHWTERVLWAGVWGAALWMAGAVSWRQWGEPRLSFLVKSDHLTWDTAFPALSLCQSHEDRTTARAASRLYGEERDFNLDTFLKEVAYFDGACLSCSTHCKLLNCTSNFTLIQEHVLLPCGELFDSCSWKGVSFDCCSQFKPLLTEIGLCFTINSAQTSGTQTINMISNREKGLGKLSLKLRYAVELYLHSREDLPFVNHPEAERASVPFPSNYDMDFQLTETENSEGVEEVPVEERGCRFGEESGEGGGGYRGVYSYSSCVVRCRGLRQAALCGCTQHFLPRLAGVKTCDVEGLACLTSHSDTLSPLVSQGSYKEGLHCACAGSCSELELVVVRSSLSNSFENISSVEIRLASLPKERFARTIVRSGMTMTVSVGGTLGLFFGASFLSGVELPYFLFIRRK